jgi:hypothetical protein
MAYDEKISLIAKKYPNDKPDRKRLRHRTQPNPKDKGVPQPQNRPRYGL